MKTKDKINRKLFEINLKDEKIKYLIDRYELHPEDYAENGETQEVAKISSWLTQWERIVWYAYTENHSIRKLAAFFGVKPYYTRKAIENLLAKIKDNYRKSQQKDMDISWI